MIVAFLLQIDDTGSSGSLRPGCQLIYRAVHKMFNTLNTRQKTPQMKCETVAEYENFLKEQIHENGSSPSHITHIYVETQICGFYEAVIKICSGEKQHLFRRYC